MNITSTNTTSRNIALQNVDFDKNATTNVHAVIRDEDNLTNQVDVESNITKSINAVSIDWNKVKFNSTKAKLPSVVRNESSLLFDNDFLKQIVNDGIFETSQLIRMLEIYAEALSTFMLYIGNLTYVNSDNEIVDFTISNDGNNEQLIHSIIETLKSEGKIEYIRTESDIYAPKSNPVVVGNKEYYVRLVNWDRLFLICPKFMFDSFIDSYKIGDNQIDMLYDPSDINSIINIRFYDSSTPTFTYDGIEYVILYLTETIKTVIFRDVHISKTDYSEKIIPNLNIDDNI